MNQTALRSPSQGKRLKPMILSYYFLSTLLFCIVISFFAVFAANRVAVQRVKEQFSEAIRSVALQMERDLRSVREISDYLYVNRDVKRIILYHDARNYAFVRACDAMDTLLSQNVLSNVFTNLNAVVIFSGQNNVYQFVNDHYYRQFDIAAIANSPNFTQAIQSNAMVLSRQAESELYSKNNQHTFSVFRSIRDERYRDVIGGVFLSFRLDVLDNHMLTGDAQQLITDLVDVNGQSMTNAANILPQRIIQWLAKRDHQAVVSAIDESGRVYFCYPLSDFNCFTVGSLPLGRLNADKSLLLLIMLAALFVSVLLSSLIWRFLDHRVMPPLSRVTRSLKQASKGAFVPLDNISSGIEEIDSLARNYNRAISQIDTLVSTLVEQRTEYKELEYKALQSQISSHFITNTLNAVRWLAILQKADNIKLMIDAFSRLLKSTWQGIDSDSTLGQEISNVKDYIYLQQVTHSYKCDISYDIDEGLRSVPCIKFILQPLVENAFFHGIAPKDGTGTIRISVRGSEVNGLPAVRLTVWDDGVGMTQETIRAIFESQISGSRFNGIGVCNIHERLQLKYGTAFGVTMESMLGSYTQATVLMPVAMGKEAEHDQRTDC